MDKILRLQYYNGNDFNPFSLLNIRYLYNIIQLCKNHNIELNLLNTPLHYYYYSKIPNEYIEKNNQITIDLKLKVIDFSYLNLDESCFIADGEHLSAEVSILVTSELTKGTNTENAVLR
jgi:hypothetical protein